MLIEDCELVFLKPDVLLLLDTYREMLRYVCHRLEENGVINIGELRDAFSTSRRIADALPRLSGSAGGHAAYTRRPYTQVS
ncbi:MAG: hypothetical protein BroJett018_46830 [Chloroflexota bacterium]|nr:hypothetical protein [Chloroflexota bacterium]GIK66889.1 MAG: hypothetical protein BroJett018_46830 [Chloroflexota bacterium]